ncbi:TetR/AcrR family transcriptional regulator [Nocardioides pantholopis]|uniref:TetR/AcrR family transcriptional regulator n=1 Tax=Nocardioides pantholopis TaxID=2483798 RepID=UPI000FD7FDF6|nr:TetR/AcrR family transcriptional regulator [Nocardioides pantholopis]
MPPAAQSATERGARTRARILDATAAVLNANGYAGTRLSEIASVARLQTPAIYYYFSSRDEVIEAVVAAGHQSVIDHVAGALADMTGASNLEKILAAVEAHLTFVLTESQYASASIRNLGHLPAEMRTRQLSQRRAYGQMWKDLFEAGQQAGEFDPEVDIADARMLILGALNWAPEWWDPSRGALGAIVAEAKRFVRKGLSA